MAESDKLSSRDYSFLDRLIHRMAFAHPVIQRALGEIESDMYAAKFEGHSAARPVFVTGLPRAGTTLLLELFYRTGEFSTFTYREMPFVMAPLFWASATKSGRKAGEARERAHGDGMEVSFDSPEAFEEVAWLSYLRDAYVKDGRQLPLGRADVSDEFREAFVRLVRKLSAAQNTGAATRYLSKNNGNIGRLDAVKSIFPDATIFVCVRRPAAHVASLMSQHKRFLDMHAEDAFSRDYMGWIGHFDFGANFRPIDFANSGRTAADADSAEFWLKYWIDAYGYAYARKEAVKFAVYEDILADPSRALGKIAAEAGLSDAGAFSAGAASIRQPTTTPNRLEGAAAALLAEADALYDKIRAVS